MKRLVRLLLGRRLQVVLIASFSLIAALTVGLSTIATSRVINDYLTTTEADLVARDMELAKSLYQMKLDEVAAISYRMARDVRVIESLPVATRGADDAVQTIDQQIIHKSTVPTVEGTHLVAIFDTQGNILVSRVLLPAGELSSTISRGNWSSLPILKEALSSGEAQVATEVIPAELLSQVGLAQQARIALVDTPLAALKPFDAREGTAGLTLCGVHSIKDEDGQIIGAVLAAYLFNNDFTLVDRIRQVARIDTVTVFFGDLRVSTNVMTEQGTRAVGTRISQIVRDVVLEQGRDYVGRAYVVNEWFITRYEPLRNYQGEVVGSLYVGALESAFLSLVHTFNNQVILIALVCVILAGLIAVPIARLITQPIAELVEANQRLAHGDMTVRVQVYNGGGELAVLGHSFNQMVETLHQTQQELLHKEKLASVGQLAAGVAHEINNPLGTILLFADVLHNELPEGDAWREDLKMIIDETTRCKNIVADLLNFARQQEVLAQNTDIHTLLEQVLEETVYQDRFEGVEIVRKFASDVPIIQADANQLQQVFINLLNNAADAVEHEGKITLSTRLVENHRVEIAVSDTGCGIPQENLDKIFAPFYTTKPQGKGTGLGLSIVYGIVKMHRGQIAVTSEVGRGTTFTVTLPVKLPDRQLGPVNGSMDLIGA